MKKHIRYLVTHDDSERESIKNYLNHLNFYVLTVSDDMLDVNVIEEEYDLMEDIWEKSKRLITKFGNGVTYVRTTQRRLLKPLLASVLSVKLLLVKMVTSCLGK